MTRRRDLLPDFRGRDVRRRCLFFVGVFLFVELLNNFINREVPVK